jgi:hypothetical protein
VFCQPDGIETSPESVMESYPNPVSDRLYLKGVNDNDQLEVWDMAGRKRCLILEKGSVDVRALPLGKYLLTITNKDAFSKLSFIIVS